MGDDNKSNFVIESPYVQMKSAHMDYHEYRLVGQRSPISHLASKEMRANISGYVDYVPSDFGMSSNTRWFMFFKNPTTLVGSKVYITSIELNYGINDLLQCEVEVIMENPIYGKM